MRKTPRPRAQQAGGPLRFALSGVIAAALFLGLAHLASTLFAPTSSPLQALGTTVIRLTPGPIQEFAISAFGSYDKPVLYLCMGIVGAALAGSLGVLGSRRVRAAIIGFCVVAVVLGSAVASLPETSPEDLIPTGVGFVAGVIVLQMLLRSARVSRSDNPQGPSAGPATHDAEQRRRRAEPVGTPSGADGSRRTFLLLAGGASVLAAASFAVGQTLVSSSRRVVQAMRDLVLPAPAVEAAAVPSGASVDVSGVEPLITPNDQFYRIDTALAVPEVLPEEWSLRIHGMVEDEVTITMDELLGEPLEEHYVTLTCVSNPVGGDLLGNALWLGYPVRELLKRARPTSRADMVLSRSVDGFTASTPLEVLTDDRAALLAVGMNGEPLPLNHGFPARLVVPGLYGFVSATKWVTELEVTRFDEATAYWTDRGWDAKAPILVASRIDVPRSFASVSAGEVTLGGSAWAQHEGISAVQISIDDGEWEDAELAEELHVDTWRQWRFTYADAEPGRHTATVRAVSKSGEVQTGERRDSVPNSATGHHRVDFTVE